MSELSTQPVLDRAAVVKVPVLLSVAHVAQLLDCSPKTIRRRIAEGYLPAVIEHERMMVRGDDLRAYIERLQRVSARPRGARQPQARAGRHEFDW